MPHIFLNRQPVCVCVRTAHNCAQMSRLKANVMLLVFFLRFSLSRCCHFNHWKCRTSLLISCKFYALSLFFFSSTHLILMCTFFCLLAKETYKQTTTPTNMTTNRKKKVSYLWSVWIDNSLKKIIIIIIITGLRPNPTKMWRWEQIKHTVIK